LNPLTIGLIQANNPSLVSVDLPLLTHMYAGFSFLGNWPTLHLNFPSLQLTGTVQIANIQAINIPMLYYSEVLNITGGGIESLAAPSFNSSLNISISDCPLLKSLSFPELSLLDGDLAIQGNDNLSDIDGFPNLVTVKGRLTCVGPFRNMSFPSLVDVLGPINVNSISNESNCPSIQNRTLDTVKGQLVCTSKNISGNGTGDPGSANGGANTKGRLALNISLRLDSIAGIVGGVCGALVILLLLWVYRERRKRKSMTISSDQRQTHLSELHLGKKTNAKGPAILSETLGGRTLFETSASCNLHAERQGETIVGGQVREGWRPSGKLNLDQE